MYLPINIYIYTQQKISINRPDIFIYFNGLVVNLMREMEDVWKRLKSMKIILTYVLPVIPFYLVQVFDYHSVSPYCTEVGHVIRKSKGSHQSHQSGRTTSNALFDHKLCWHEANLIFKICTK